MTRGGRGGSRCEKLGYDLNGITRVAPRPGEPDEERRVRVKKASFVRPHWSISVRGTQPALTQLGVDMYRGSSQDSWRTVRFW